MRDQSMAVLFLEELLSFSGLRFYGGHDHEPHEQQLTICSRWPSGHRLAHWGGGHCLKLNVLLWCVPRTREDWEPGEQGFTTGPPGLHYDRGLLMPPPKKNTFFFTVYKCISMRWVYSLTVKLVFFSFWFYKKLKHFCGSLKILGDLSTVSTVPDGEVALQPRQVTSQWLRPW